MPVIPDMPPSNCSDPVHLSNKLYTTQVLSLNQNHNCKHVPSCFKTSGHAKSGNCRFYFPRVYQENADVTEDCIIAAERNIGSEYIDNFKPVLLHVFDQIMMLDF